MSSRQALRLEYVTSAESRSAGWHDVLGAAAFDGSAKDAERALRGDGIDVPLAHVHTPVLGDAREVLEVWRIGAPTRTGSSGHVRYSHGGDFLFGSVAVHEEELASVAGSGPRTALELATDLVYREMYATLAAAGNPTLIRVWNYLPDINLETHGLERYRQFNTARHEALLACGHAVAGSVPAASALGVEPASPLTLYFLASHRAPAFIENPRQVSAYHYPRTHGPMSPSFSRAMVAPDHTVLVSGTASIVGHVSQHADDVAAQLRESVANLEALLAEGSKKTQRRFALADCEALRVYVRDPADLARVQAAVAQTALPAGRVVYLQGDVCRRELSVELEGVFPAGRA